MLRIWTLGQLRATVDDVDAAWIHSQRRRAALLTYLALEGTVAREKITAMFWPDSSPDHARRALNQAVYDLRRRVGERVVVVQPEGVGLAADRWVDALAFERAVGDGEEGAALELYRGEFLGGLRFGDSPAFEQWVEMRGAALRRHHRALRRQLIGRQIESGELSAALSATQAWVRIEPEEDEAHHRLLELLAATGERAEALRHFEAYRRRLEEEELTPLSETLALAESLRDGDTAALPGPIVPLPQQPAPEAVATVAATPTDDEPLTRLPRRPHMLAGAAVLLLILVGSVGMHLVGRGRTGVSEDFVELPAVAVLPFRTAGDDSEIWREGIVHLLSYNLEGLGALRKIDPRVVLNTWHQVLSATPDADGNAIAREVARRTGAGYVISGSAVRNGASVHLSADVYVADAAQLQGSVTAVNGQADSLQALVDRLTIELIRRDLLPSGSPLPPVNLGRITTTSIPALRAYLSGEEQYRRGHWREAAASFQQAIEADSTFARALFRLGNSYSWVNEVAPLRHEYYARAVRFAERMPERDRLLIVGTATGNLTMLRELTTKYPDDVDGWYHLGDQAFHRGGNALYNSDVFRMSLENAIAQAPHYLKAYVHLIEDAVVRLDRERARRLIAAHDSINPSHPDFRIAYDLAWGDSAAAARARAILDTITRDVLDGWVTLAIAPAAVERAELLDRAIIRADGPSAEPVAALWRSLQARVMRGEMRAAQRVLAYADSAPFVRIDVARWRAILHVAGYPDQTAAQQASAVLALEPLPEDHFWLGALAAVEGRWQDVEHARQSIEMQLADEDDVASWDLALAPGLHAFAALRRGEIEHLPELNATLERMRTGSFRGEEPAKLLRYEAGRALYDAGMPEEAERYFQTFYPYDWVYYILAQFYLGRIHEARGAAAVAREHYGRVAGWWANSDPEMESLPQQAREALARLDDSAMRR